MLDSVADQRRGTRLPVRFDVCGLAAGTKFSAEIRFRKRVRIGRGDTRSNQYPDEANSNRERRIRVVDLSQLSTGDWYLDVVVTDEKGNNRGATKEFKLLNR